ncbi:MAG: hypothetical protein J6T16_04480 [Opitutales bacterium]|nr:hypothetical protein [Opitutales bacterium]
MKTPSALSVFFAIILSAIFAYAGFAKLANPSEFFESLIAYQSFPQSICLAICYVLPPLEILAAIGIWTKRYIKAAALIIAGLNIAFIAVVSSAWIRGLDISCGCFGDVSSISSEYAYIVLRDALLFAMGVFLFKFHRKYLF